MTAEAGHNYRFGPPATGWPTFKDGKIVGKKGSVSAHLAGIRDAVAEKDPDVERADEIFRSLNPPALPIQPHDCPVCAAQQRPVPKPNDYGDDDFGGQS